MKFSLPLALLAGLCAVAWLITHSKPHAAPDNTKTITDPKELCEKLNDDGYIALKEEWDRLGLVSNPYTVNLPNNRVKFMDIAAKLLEEDLDGDGADENILEVKGGDSQVWQYVVFKQKDNLWALTGDAGFHRKTRKFQGIEFFDLPGFRGRVARFVSDDDTTAKVDAYQERWYTLSDNRFETRLSLPISGSRNDLPMTAWEYRGMFEPELPNFYEPFNVNYSVKVTGGSSLRAEEARGKPLFEFHKSVTFQWSEKNQGFEVKAKESDWSRKELDKAFSTGFAFDYEDWAMTMKEHIIRMLKAAKGNAALAHQSAWAREFAQALPEGSAAKQFILGNLE